MKLGKESTEYPFVPFFLIHNLICVNLRNLRTRSYLCDEVGNRVTLLHR